MSSRGDSSEEAVAELGVEAAPAEVAEQEAGVQAEEEAVVQEVEGVEVLCHRELHSRR